MGSNVVGWLSEIQGVEVLSALACVVSRGIGILLWEQRI